MSFGMGNASKNSAAAQAAHKKINRYFTNLKPFYVKTSEEDTTLLFESRFESGNLRRVVQTNPESRN
jgi:hypothetical protein